MYNLIWGLALVLLPGALLLGAKQFRLLRAIGPVVLAYVAGVLLGNIPGLGIPVAVAKPLTEITIVLALPLLLFGADFLRWLRTAGGAILAYGLAIVSVAIVALLVGLFFPGDAAENAYLIGMFAGAATGGGVNLNAVGISLQAPPELLISANFADIAWGGIYLLLVLSVAKPLLAKILPPYRGVIHTDEVATDTAQVPTTTGQVILRYLLAFGVAVLCLAGAFALAEGGLWLIKTLTGNATKGLETVQLTLIFLGITIFGLAASLRPQIRRLKEAEKLGDYLILVFIVALGAQVDFTQMGLHQLNHILLGGCLIYGSVALHLFFCWLFRVDVDTAIISSGAAIMSPPLLGPVADAIGNRQVLISGLTTGIIGYAIGTYLGIGLAHLLLGWAGA